LKQQKPHDVQTSSSSSLSSLLKVVRKQLYTNQATYNIRMIKLLLKSLLRQDVFLQVER